MTEEVPKRRGRPPKKRLIATPLNMSEELKINELLKRLVVACAKRHGPEAHDVRKVLDSLIDQHVRAE